MGILDTLREAAEMLREASGSERSYHLREDSRGAEWMTVGKWTQYTETIAIEYMGGAPNPMPKRPDVFANKLVDLYEVNEEALGKHPVLRAPILKQLEYLEKNYPDVMEGHKAQALADYIRNADVVQKTDPSQIMTLLPGGKVQVGDATHSGITHIREGKDGTLVPFDEFAARGAGKTTEGARQTVGGEQSYGIGADKSSELAARTANGRGSAVTREGQRPGGNGDLTLG